MIRYTIKQTEKFDYMYLQKRITTTEDTPVFDRTRVSLEIPSSTFGTGFTLITNVSKILNSVILVSTMYIYHY